jgi:hypothetical protein
MSRRECPVWLGLRESVRKPLSSPLAAASLRAFTVGVLALLEEVADHAQVGKFEDRCFKLVTG